VRGMTDQRAAPDAPRSESPVWIETAPSGAGRPNGPVSDAEADTVRIILDLTRSRGPMKSICPSEAARALATRAGVEAWQHFMKPVRQAAIRLARAGQIEIVRKGKPVALPLPPNDVRGVIRLRITDKHQGINVEQKE
jgi:hypothetical protein